MALCHLTGILRLILHLLDQKPSSDCMRLGRHLLVASLMQPSADVQAGSTRPDGSVAWVCRAKTDKRREVPGELLERVRVLSAGFAKSPDMSRLCHHRGRRFG